MGYRNGFLYTDKHRIWSIHRDLDWNWDILDDRVRYGFFNWDVHRYRSINWNIYRIRHWFLNRDVYQLLHWNFNRIWLWYWDVYHLLHWNFNRIWLWYWVSDLLGLYVGFDEKTVSITVTSTNWQ
jgi:hypothetical protein